MLDGDYVFNCVFGILDIILVCAETFWIFNFPSGSNLPGTVMVRDQSSEILMVLLVVIFILIKIILMMKCPPQDR